MPHRATFVYLLLAIALLATRPSRAVAQDAGAQDAVDSSKLRAEVEVQLKHAETYYWFGMSELGNLAEFEKGKRHLAQAAELVERLPPGEAAAGRYGVRMAGLTDDLDEQIEIAHDTLYGLFPMTRFLVRSIFADATTMGNYELIDDPTVMASTAATRKLALETIREWTHRHQLDVAFTSIPHNPALENEALYLFNSHSKFFVHNAREVADALNDAQLAEFQAGRVTPEIVSAMLAAFKIRDLLVVRVLEIDVVDGDYFYIIGGKIYHREQPTPTHDFAVMGFSRDRNSLFLPIVLMNGLMLALAYAALYLQLKIRQRATVRASLGTLLVLPLLAFAVGRCTPWAIGPLLSRIAPIPESLAIVSFWLPCVAGASVTVLPMILFWLVCQRLGKLWPMFNTDGRAAALLAGIGAGSAGFFAVPLLVYMPPVGAVSAVTATTLAVVFLGFLLGRALDSVDRLSGNIAFVPILLSLFVGAAVFQCLTSWAWGAAGLVLASCFAPTLFDRSRQKTAEKKKTADPVAPAEKGKLPTVALREVAERAERPEFQKSEHYEDYLKRLQPMSERRSVQLGLHGPGGCGLTSTANSLLGDVVARLKSQGVEVTTMCGECSHALGEPTPYRPFQKALAQHFEIELLAAPESKLAEIDAALGDVFQSVVPFAGILFPSVGGSAANPSSGEEIVPSITWMFRRLSKTKPVILLIDDAQWLDKASKSLLQHLLKEFAPGGPDPICILVASHDARVLSELGLAPENQAELPHPPPEHQLRILTDGVGLSPATAELVVEQLGTYAVEQGGLFWLLQIVENLNRSGAFVASDEGVSLAEGKWPEDVFVPDQMRDVLVQQLRKFPEYRMIIECAACACDAREFSAGVVADALGRSRLEMLADLDRIDRETSLLYDIRAADDTFAFQSSFMLDVVREELRIVDSGPTSGDAPQIIREYHARIAAELEESLKTNSNKIYAVANHYYASGSAKAALGLKYCIEAARAAANVLDFDAAGHYLRRAEECAQVTGEMARVQSCRLDVECRVAHLSGKLEELERVADWGAEFLSTHPDCSTRLKLSVAQVHYDAGKGSGDREWFNRSLAIGNWIIDGAATPQEEALGRHFVGISLPPDRREERRQQLRKAKQIMEAAPEDAEDFELLGRITGSLAEELSRGDEQDQVEAKQLFELRIQINEQHQVGDPQGQAMTHGGLGRLAFYGASRDMMTAAYHFEKDLEISEAIGDRQGQIQMHSLLGACCLEEDRVDDALKHYEESWELSLDGRPINMFFAGVGLLECYSELNQVDPFRGVARRLLGLSEDEGVPPACTRELASVLSLCSSEMLNDEAAELLEIVLAARAKLDSA